jgi:ArsR family transcriptional regulator
MAHAQTEKIAVLFAALSEPNRVAILHLLGEAREEVCVYDIATNFKIDQTTVSRHLKILKEAGLITSEKRGKWVYYRATREKNQEVKTILDQLMHLSQAASEDKK